MFYKQDDIVIKHIDKLFNAINRMNYDDSGNVELNIPKIYITYPVGYASKTHIDSKTQIKNLDN